MMISDVLAPGLLVALLS